MKVKDISKQYGIDNSKFSDWLETSSYQTKSGVMGGFDLVDGQDVAAIVSEFKAHEQDAKDQAAQAAADAARAAQEKQQALASMLITSGFNFDGFTITRYSGYISGDDAVSVERPTHSWAGVKGNVGDDLLEALVRIRRNALVELKEAAYALGCNAVIGVDFDYLTLDPEINMKGSAGTATVYLPFLFGVTANGNAVVIEKTG